MQVLSQGAFPHVDEVLLPLICRGDDGDGSVWVRRSGRRGRPAVAVDPLSCCFAAAAGARPASEGRSSQGQHYSTTHAAGRLTGGDWKMGEIKPLSHRQTAAQFIPIQGVLLTCARTKKEG